MPKPAFDPCIPTRGVKVPGRPEWLHEIKHDGYRLIVQREGIARSAVHPQRVRLEPPFPADRAGRFTKPSDLVCDRR